MNKEFILGVSYRCLTSRSHNLTHGKIYKTVLRTDDSWCNGVVSLIGDNDYCWVLPREDFLSTFEEVKDEDNTIQVIEVGGKVEYIFNPIDIYNVVGIHGKTCWLHSLNIEGRDCYYSEQLSNLTKVKDIRTIECAGGAVRITGEYVKTCAGRVQVQTEQSIHNMTYHWGTEVS